MKLKVLSFVFMCNGYLANLSKCDQTLLLVGTEEEINKQYELAGWRFGTSKAALSSNYHVCNKAKHVNPVAGAR